jgi:DNA polymerase-3 subunit delta'
MFDDFDDDEYSDLEDANSTTVEEAPSLKPPRENQEVLGHEQHEQNLLAMYNQGNLPHALIFAGQKGIGKSTFAYNLARFLLKQGGDNSGGLFGDAPPPATSLKVAEDDPVTRKIASEGHPDLLTIRRPVDEKKGSMKAEMPVEVVRKIAPFLRMTSSNGGWRVVIVDDAETMNRNAQNAILKILEEPPQKALLILVCHRLGAMIPTIRSRCRTLHFQPLSRDHIISVVKNGTGYISGAQQNLLADMADGSVGQALSFHEEGGEESLREILLILSSFPKWDWPLIHRKAEEFGRFGASDQPYNLFRELLLWVCECLLRAKAAGPQKLPEILRTDSLIALQNHYSLEQWIDICEKLKGHFSAVDFSNLDKRQGVLGAFSLLG